jgi:hypothetical protein
MALDNAQLVEHCNDELRQLGDMATRFITRVKAAKAEYIARNLGTIINDGGASNLIVDGSASDGRTPVTGGDVYNIQTFFNNVEAVFDAVGVADVIAKWNVNGHKA